MMLLAIPLVIGFVGRLIYMFAITRSVPPDGQRFVNLANALRAGDYPVLPNLSTVSAPGYPAFLAGIFSIYDSFFFLGVVHYLLSVASCFLVYFAVKPRNRNFALAILIFMALSPLTGRLMVTVLSETLSIFLASALVYCLSRMERKNARDWHYLVYGLTLVALALTTPAAVPIFYCLVIAFVYQFRVNKKWLGLFSAGILILMIPWQIYCVKQTRSLQPRLYFETPHSALSNGYFRWLRTWLANEGDLYFDYNPTKIHEAPARAFEHSMEKKRLIETNQKWADGQITWDEYNGIFMDEANKKIAFAPIDFHIVRPIKRMVKLFLVPPHVIHGHGMVMLAYFANLILLAVCIFHKNNLKNPQAIAILVGVGAYLWLSGYLGMGEERRNQVFYPFLYFLAFYRNRG